MNKGKKPFSLIRFAENLCVILLAAMTFITFINVLSRYVFHSSISASEEITTNLFVLLSLVGAALAARNKQHLGLNLLPDKLSPKGKLIHGIFEGVAGMAFIGYLAYYGYQRVFLIRELSYNARYFVDSSLSCRAPSSFSCNELISPVVRPRDERLDDAVLLYRGGQLRYPLAVEVLTGLVPVRFEIGRAHV